jgi:hypothetical protein
MVSEHWPISAPEGRFIVQGKMAVQCLGLWEEMCTRNHS